MSSRPRPKPRAATRPQPTSTDSVPSSSSQRVVDDDAVTALFTKKTTWKALQERDQRARQAEPISSPGADGSSDDEAPTPQTKGGKSRPLPAWTRKPANIDEAIVISDDSDLELLSGSEDSPSRKRLRQNEAHSKNKKARSRSRSITPPPPVPLAARERVAQLVSETFGAGRRPRSRSPDADASFGSTRVEDLDPELQKILNQVKSGTIAHTTNVGPSHVDIMVDWVYHPEDIDAEPKSWAVRASRHATFKRLFATIADELGLPRDEVVLTYQKNQVFPGATPDSLKMWDKGEMEACHPTTREYIRSQRRTQRTLTPPPAEHSAPSRETTGSPGDNPPTKLVFRSSHTPEGITIAVRDTATCEAVVNHYIRKVPELDKLKPALKAKITLQFDGESIARKTVLSELGAEDGDIFEVIGF